MSAVLDVDSLPLIPGAEPLLKAGYKTRASNSNRSFAEPTMHIAGSPNSERLEFAFDAQTSGGLLISVAPERADELVEQAREGGAQFACRGMKNKRLKSK